MHRVFAALFACVLYVAPANAVEPFPVEDIRVEGVQRISPGTVFNYLPIKVGETLTEKRAQEAIRALFKTGFFADIRLEREGNVLVVTVIERPAIASINISGTREISDADLKKSLRDIGFVEGRVFNRSLLEQIEQELERQYFGRGRYSVKIRPTVTPLERNRVAVDIEVREGRTARIREINIVNNRQFTDKELLKLFRLRTKGGLFGKKNQYSRQELVGDLERLRNFYQDQGFLEFDITSTQVSITPDKEQIYITVNLSEGKKFTISDVTLSGQMVVPEGELRQFITIKPGDVFSRRRITEITKNISDKLGNEGYAFANINAIPDVDRENATVAFTFFVDPGKRVYVRRINFSGNTSTHDEVLRREMRQLEGGWFSTGKIQRSRERLQRTGFFDEVTIETPPVPGSPDQVDVNVTVKERLTGNLLFGVGFSDSDGILFNASVRETNLFGTGRELAVSLDNSSSNTFLNVRYVNPYYRKGGISRGFRGFYSDFDAAEQDLAAYDTETVGGGIFFGLPLSEARTLNLGFDLQNTEIGVDADSAQVAQDFVAANGEENAVLLTTVGWSQNSLDRRIFPSRGATQRISAELAVPGSELEYYKLTYSASRYWPVSRRTSFRIKGELGLGDGYGDTEDLPFYENFFAGGTRSVRGYESRSLGPRDTRPPFDPIGGSRRVLGNLEYIFPLPGAQPGNRSMRLSVFVDAGQVYGPGPGPGEDIDLGELRYSMGLAFNWFSPVGPLAISIASPLNDEPQDETETLQFTLGVPFN
ncbi:MAG: outer membrane protein assembly factor BamA [Acidiferrobacterales bacterium]